MLKSEKQIQIEVISKGLRDIIQEFEDELENLDPFATYDLKMIVAKLKGIQMYAEEVKSRGQ